MSTLPLHERTINALRRYSEDAAQNSSKDMAGIYALAQEWASSGDLNSDKKDHLSRLLLAGTSERGVLPVRTAKSDEMDPAPNRSHSLIAQNRKEALTPKDFRDLADLLEKRHNDPIEATATDAGKKSSSRGLFSWLGMK